MIKQEDVTIIIPHLGATPQQIFSLDQCLTSLLETCQCKIIIAKNGASEIPYSSSDPRVMGISLEEQGQNRAVNAAVSISETPWVLITNDDMVYPEGWFEKLVTSQIGAEWPEQVKCISPKLIEPIDGAPTFQKYFCGGAGGDFDKQKFLDFAKDYYQKRQVMSDAGYQTGFNLPFLISRDLWNTIEGYDINYDPWGSNGDSDLEYKIRLAGVQPYQNTNAVVYHFSQTSGTSHPDNRPFWDKNWHYFIDKWGFERASSPSIWTADFTIPTLAEGRKYAPSWEGRYA